MIGHDPEQPTGTVEILRPVSDEASDETPATTTSSRLFRRGVSADAASVTGSLRLASARLPARPPSRRATAVDRRCARCRCHRPPKPRRAGGGGQAAPGPHEPHRQRDPLHARTTPRSRSRRTATRSAASPCSRSSTTATASRRRSATRSSSASGGRLLPHPRHRRQRARPRDRLGDRLRAPGHRRHLRDRGRRRHFRVSLPLLPSDEPGPPRGGSHELARRARTSPPPSVTPRQPVPSRDRQEATMTPLRRRRRCAVGFPPRAAITGDRLRACRRGRRRRSHGQLDALARSVWTGQAGAIALPGRRAAVAHDADERRAGARVDRPSAARRRPAVRRDRARRTPAALRLDHGR